MPPNERQKCAMGTWVRGVGVKPCRNRARYLGYYSEMDKRPVCGRHTRGFTFLGPLEAEESHATDD